MTIKRTSKTQQFVISISLIALLSVCCYLLKSIIDYRVAALVLLLAVSALAVLFDIYPVLLSAFLSAVILNFLFIDPVFNYKIANTETAFLFFVYMLIAVVSAILTNKLRKQEIKIRDREEKENTIRLYNTLLNSLSHELKTPIATIIATADTLKENDLQISAEQRSGLLTEIEIAGNRLNKQVENLLNMSRLETGTFRLKADWCEINELIFMVIRKPDLDLGKIEFQPDEKLPLFRLDSGLMETVLYNIIHNAVRYTPVHAKIHIQVSWDDNQLMISIRDTGQGIPLKEADLVFEKFYRLPDSGTGGSGLGLSIARGFTEAHNGNLILRQNSGSGAEFIITIPSEISYIKNLNHE